MTAVEPSGWNQSVPARPKRKRPNPATRISPEQHRKMVQATRLRADGMEYRDVARIVELPLGTTYRLVNRGLRQILKDAGGEEEIARILARMDRATMTAMSILMDSTREPLVRLAAVDRLVKVDARRASLLGLDAPKNINLRADVRVVAVETLDAEIAATEALIAAGSLVLDANSSVTVESVTIEVEDDIDGLGDGLEDDESDEDTGDE